MVTLLPINFPASLRRKNETIAPAWPPTETTEVFESGGSTANFYKALTSFATFPNMTGILGSELLRAFIAFDSSSIGPNEITAVKLKMDVAGAPGCSAQLNPDGSPGYDFFDCMPNSFPPFNFKVYSWTYSGAFGGAAEWSNVGAFLVEVTTEGFLEITIPTSVINREGYTGFAILFSDEASGPPAPTITDPRAYNFIGQSYIASSEAITLDFNAPGSGLEVTQSDTPPVDPPEIVQPDEGDKAGENTEFRHSGSLGSTVYTIEITKPSDPEFLIEEETEELMVAIPLEPGVYEWRVKGDNTEYSAAVEFEVIEVEAGARFSSSEVVERRFSSRQPNTEFSSQEVEKDFSSAAPVRRFATQERL